MKIQELLGVVFSRLPIKKNWVYFSSFYGLYNDNPKAISEKLHEYDKKLVLIWEHSARSHDDIPEYCLEVKAHSIKSKYYFSRAYVIVDNGAGYFYYSKSHKYHMILKRMINKHSINISTWHGTPLKHIGFDIPNTTFDRNSLVSSTKAIFAGSDYEYKVFSNCFSQMFPVLKIGNPRNDVLIHNEKKVNDIKKRLGLPINKKILLYCPTYRDNLDDSGIIQLHLMNIEELKSTLSEKFDGEWDIVFRAHQMVFERINFEELGLINGNIGDDMADYLLCADAIITDYSGSLFDICLTDKPCFLFAHDKEKYLSEERGSYLGLEELPFPFAETYDALKENIKRYSYDNDKANKKSFNDRIGTYNDGFASERAAKFILDLVDRGKEAIDAKNICHNATL